MENTRVILLEGLPGTGKSTKSYFLSMQLEREGKTAKWIHEVARPHPVLFFHEASLTYAEYQSIIKTYPRSQSILNQLAVFRKNTVGIDLLELEWNAMGEIGLDAFRAVQHFDVWTFSLEKYAEVALEKWAYFTEKALEKEDTVYILDSAIFQYQIFTYLLKNASYDELEGFVQKLIRILMPLHPSLVYLYRDKTQDTIDFLENLRGKQFLEGIWERDRNQPYYSDKPSGAIGQKHFLMDYAAIAKQLFEHADFRKMSIELSKQDWETQENLLLSFLGTKRKSYPNTLPPNGIFRNEPLEQTIEVNGLSIQDPNGTKRALTPKSEDEFYVECLPVVLHFDGVDKITISGQQICERWTTLGTQFLKVNQ